MFLIHANLQHRQRFIESFRLPNIKTVRVYVYGGCAPEYSLCRVRGDGNGMRSTGGAPAERKSQIRSKKTGKKSCQRVYPYGLDGGNLQSGTTDVNGVFRLNTDLAENVVRQVRAVDI